MKYKLEVAVYKPWDACEAYDLGANRIQLNARGSRRVGGLTPSLPDVAKACNWVKIPVRVVIRPRGGHTAEDFVYTEAEFARMRTSIRIIAVSGLLDERRGDGFVFGVLEKSDGGYRLDVERNRLLIDDAYDYPCVCLTAPWTTPWLHRVGKGCGLMRWRGSSGAGLMVYLPEAGPETPWPMRA